MPGRKPASVMPTSIRSTYKLVGQWQTWCSRGDAPKHHDGGDPAPCTDNTQHNVAGNAEDDVSGVEQGGSEAKHGGAQTEVASHRESGKADVDAIKEREDKQHEQKDDRRRNSFLITACCPAVSAFMLIRRIDTLRYGR